MNSTEEIFVLGGGSTVHTMAIFGIVVLAIFILASLIAALMLFPDFLRYMKMRSL
jgi:predicted RND superfamily exporter protein